MEHNHKSSLSDTPFDEDRNDFGTDSYVNGLINFIENSSAPITIALQGEWGSGKTSLMTRLERALCSDNGSFVGIDINTWEYSMLSTPEETVFRIIEQLVKQLSHDDPKPKNKLKKFLKNTGNIGFKIIREGVKSIHPAAALGVEAFVPSSIDEKTDDTEDVSLSDLKIALEESVQKIKGNNKKGVIIFVDDLDRLNPPVAVEILELLKNIFCIKDCIFVLAIDYEVVVKGLEPKFGKLTDRNEREFRSFFDKIIQVPFSLPVSSYEPLDFVLDSLVNIGYITQGEKSDARLKNPIREIVECSVGKNPRSIKRLINTLSLLSCIAKFAKDDDAGFTRSRTGRLVNFAVVALQVCYPRIYRMLANGPDFTAWDQDLAMRMGIVVNKDTEAKNVETDLGWEDILEAACSTDKYLQQHFKDISNLLLFIQSSLDNYNPNEAVPLSKRVQSIINKTSTTGVSEPAHNVVIDDKRMIGRLHDDILRRIEARRPEIKNIQLKKNTGNGGMFLPLPGGDRVEIIIRPKIANGKIACELILNTQVSRPADMIDKSIDEMMLNDKVRDMFASFDGVVAPLLKNIDYFEGLTYGKTYFKSFYDEQAFRISQGWHPKHITQIVRYWINLKNEDLFKDQAVVETFTDVILATYDMRMIGNSL